jgi:hypothetical protein
VDQNTRDVLVLGLGMVTTLGTGWLALELARLKATAHLVEDKVDTITRAVVERRRPRRRVDVKE